MSYNYCLECGVLLASGVHECPICGYDRHFVQNDDTPFDEILFEDELFNDLNYDFYLEDDRLN